MEAGFSKKTAQQITLSEIERRSWKNSLTKSQKKKKKKKKRFMQETKKFKKLIRRWKNTQKQIFEFLSYTVAVALNNQSKHWKFN